MGSLQIPSRKNIETERLVLRPKESGFAPAINQGIHDSHAELKPWMPWAQELPSVEQTTEFAITSEAQWQDGISFNFAIYRASDNAFVGSISLMTQDAGIPSFELGYWCSTPMTGYGYITEALLHLCGYAFETFNAQRLELCCDSRNARSRRVAERAGFSLEGKLRNQQIAPDGKLRTTLVFAMTQEDWHGESKALPDLVLRRGTAEDVDEILTLQSAWEQEAITYGYVPAPRETVEDLVGPYMIVSESGGHVIGYVVGEEKAAEPDAVLPEGGKYMELLDVYVLPKFRGHNIGSRMVETFLSRILERGFDHCRLYSSTKDLQPLLRFYERQGFKTWSATMYWNGPDDWEPCCGAAH